MTGLNIYYALANPWSGVPRWSRRVVNRLKQAVSSCWTDEPWVLGGCLPRGIPGLTAAFFYQRIKPGEVSALRLMSRDFNCSANLNLLVPSHEDLHLLELSHGRQL